MILEGPEPTKFRRACTHDHPIHSFTTGVRRIA
jgi:hypothetical protein